MTKLCFCGIVILITFGCNMKENISLWKWKNIKLKSIAIWKDDKSKNHNNIIKLTPNLKISNSLESQRKYWDQFVSIVYTMQAILNTN